MDKPDIISNEMQYLMRLFACAAKGEPVPEPKQPVSWDKLIKLAREQTVTLTVAAALCKSQNSPCPDEIKAKLYSELIGTTLKRKIQQENIFSMLDRLQNAGIQYTLLKGADVARYYAVPECRISADTDILISPDDEQKAYDFFKKEGFTVTPCKDEDNHAVCSSPKYGLIELHLRLWSNEVEKYIFNGKGIKTETCTTTVCNHTVNVLEPTCAAVFLTMHLVKHFIYSGINLRILMDTALYIGKNKDNIDSSYYNKIADELKYTKIIACLFEIAVKYFGIDRQNLPNLNVSVNEEQTNMILQDTEQGGFMGANEAESRWYVYLNFLNEKEIQAKPLPLRILSRAGLFFKRTFRAVFPTAEQLSKRYPNLTAHRWKYPFYAIHRLVFVMGKRLFTGKLGESVNAQYAIPASAEQKRLKLLKKIDII
ncbi:MAG: nucleotidyltransferase family protein [Clostridiales bacterium]|nr:nucleotidyltransferase family protein [Clostridiales bacterium]